MEKQNYFEDVEEGFELPPLVNSSTTRQIVMWSAASGDFYEVHYDLNYAKAQGLPAVLVHGRFKAALIGKMITDWVGREGSLAKISVSFRGMDFAGEKFTCKGIVKKKYISEGNHCIECDVWTENEKGDKTTIGTAIAVLPSKQP